MNTKVKISKTYQVTGMSCASCAARTESLVSKLDGVESAFVNFADSSVRIEFNPEEITPEVIRNSVRAIGYDIKQTVTTIKQNIFWAFINNGIYACMINYPGSFHCRRDCRK